MYAVFLLDLYRLCTSPRHGGDPKDGHSIENHREPQGNGDQAGC